MLVGATEMGLWVDLLRNGQERSGVHLSATEESYTAVMLERFMRRSDLMNVTLALAFLEHRRESPSKRQNSLWETADASLLMAGLFPERAKSKNVSDSYFTEMSQACYFELATVCEQLKCHEDAGTYRMVGAGVERVAYVLYCTRNRNVTVKEILRMHNILH